jgi:hypothetical protein
VDSPVGIPAGRGDTLANVSGKKSPLVGLESWKQDKYFVSQQIFPLAQQISVAKIAISAICAPREG